MNKAFLEKLLDGMLADLARDAIEKPAADMFNHGRTAGMYAGVKMVKQKLLDTLKDAEDKGAEL